MIPWWTETTPGRLEKIVLIQMDIGGHSPWLARAMAENSLQAFQDRRKLPEEIAHELEVRDYHKLFWAGDGGVFVGRLDKQSNRPSKLCDAVDAIFRVFNKWRGRKNVALRVTATLADISIDPEPGNWCSPVLNWFLKYERLLALPNAFVITQDLRVALDVKSEIDRFSPNKNRKVHLPDGNVVATFIDKKHMPKIVKSPVAFGPWLRSQANSGKLPQTSHVERSLVRVGNCTVLDYAQQISGYGEIDLEQLEAVEPGSYLESQDKEVWEQLRLELESRKVSGVSLSVAQFTSELSDDPHPRLKYRTIPYKDGRAFHALLERDQAAIARYRPGALDVLSTTGTRIPNILSTAIMAIVGTNDDDAQLVIANRKARHGGYHANTWAVSIGEQFMPVTGKRGYRSLSADISLGASIERGLKEELVGENYDGPMRLSVHAYCLEDYSNNGIFLAVADLQPLTFRQLVEYWHGAIDRAEHDAIAAIPLRNKDVLLDCMKETRLPTSIWAAITTERLFAFGPGIDMLADSSHVWQPNSHVRLALVHWFLHYAK